MSDTRRKDVDWSVSGPGVSIEGASLAVLMDIRDELRKANDYLHYFYNHEVDPPRAKRRKKKGHR